MDAAKLIALRASNSKPLDQLLREGFSPNRIPLAAVPTTAGSGSEATHFAVLFVDQKKYSVAHSTLRPRWAILDPSLTHSAPRRVAAAAGLDALCQSIESLWSLKADSSSVALASEALRLVAGNLFAAVMSREPEAQAKLALGSHLAGRAINRSFTTVCHALSYPLTSQHGVPHGLAAAATLPAAVLFNAAPLSGEPVLSAARGWSPEGECCMARCVEALLQVFDCQDVESAAARLVQLIRSIGGAASIAELQLPESYDPRAHAESIDRHRLQNNPRALSGDETLSLLLARFDEAGRRITHP
jgi:alcohol dehydrogenase class IV